MENLAIIDEVDNAEVGIIKRVVIAQARTDPKVGVSISEHTRWFLNDPITELITLRYLSSCSASCIT